MNSQPDAVKGEAQPPSLSEVELAIKRWGHRFKHGDDKSAAEELRKVRELLKKLGASTHREQT